ncbi:MAG TPA: acyltransferase [Feifaniaceae bacterium]|nr:acyltransferase [Feifaniaceae bacterium]
MWYHIAMEKETSAILAADAPATDKRKKNTLIDERHIDVLDGIRALAVLGVLWFHFWQQNWIAPYIKLPFLTSLGLSGTISLDFLPRAGFLFVDLLLFLSAFCLFLPYARAAVDGAALPSAGLFYKKRIARIVPSYYFAVFVILFFVAIPSGEYTSVRACLADLIPTLTFTQTLFPNILLGTKLNGVLWTAAIEMQFYLFFPLLAYAFVKKPGWTYLGMVAVSLLYLRGFALKNPDSIRTTLNQLPAFLGVFANGMAVSYLFVLFAKRVKRSAQLSAVALFALVAGIWLLVGMMKAAPNVSPVHLWQAEHRFRLSLVYALIVVSSALTFSGVRWFFSNAVMRFLSAISYNLYIWHQWISVKFKQWKIPYWTGDTPPNMTGDRVWQWKYTVLIMAGAFLAAILATYLVERPAAKWILRLRKYEEREPMVSVCCEEPHQEDPGGVASMNDTIETEKNRR